MGRRLGGVLALVWAVKLGVTTAAALYPLRGSWDALARFWDLADLYSLADSNLDVWALALAQTAVLAVLLGRVVAPRRRFSGLVVPPPYERVRHGVGEQLSWGRSAGGVPASCSRLPALLSAAAPAPPRPCRALQVLSGIYWCCSLAELALLGKAVLVAVLGQGAVLPPPPGSQDAGAAGLLCMYASIVACLLCSFAEAWLCAALVARWRKAHEAAEEARAGGAAEPLLGKQGKAAEVRRGGKRGM